MPGASGHSVLEKNIVYIRRGTTVWRKSEPLRSDQGALRDDQPSASSGALSIVLGHELCGDTTVSCTVPREGGHPDAVGNGEVTNLKRCKKGGRRRHLVFE